jgi:hypothetical protein
VKLQLARFIVINKLAPVDELNGSEAGFFEVIFASPAKHQQLMDYIWSPQFTTGVLDLDKEIKSWDSVFDFNQI